MGRDIIQVDDDGDVSEADEWDDGLFVNTHYDEDDMILNVTIGPKVTTISDYMFSALRIEYANLPASITSIGKYAFYLCDQLQRVTCLNPVPPTLGTRAFYRCDKMSEIRVPSSSISAYKSAAGWSDYASYFNVQ